MKSYESIKGRIVLGQHENQVSRLAIQIESINWISNINDCDLIIFDEIDSILTHIGSNKSDINNNKIEMFIKLINQYCSKIFMDGYLTINHINLI